MAISDKFSRVSDSNTGRPVIAQLASGKGVGATSVSVNAATNWTTLSKIHFAIYNTTTVSGKLIKDTSSQTEWTGDLAGTTISNIALTGGTDQTYLAGAYVELTPTAKYAKDLYDGLAVLHNPDGTFKAGAVSTTATLADSIVTTAKLADGSVTQAKLDSTIIGSWQTWTPTFTGFTLGNGVVNTARYVQVGKTVHAKFGVTLGTTSAVSGDLIVSLPSTAQSSYVDTFSANIGTNNMQSTTAFNTFGVAILASTTTVALRTLNSTGTYASINNVSATSPFTWKSTDRFTFDISYEAA